MKKFFGIVLMLLTLSFTVPVAMATVSEPARVAAAEMVKVNINAATVKELQSLPGIGKVTAERIVAHRTEKGKFSSVADLLKVKGVGEKSLEKIRGMISVE